MGLIVECASVFDFLKDVYAAFPNAIKILIFLSFFGVVYISIMRSIGR